MNLSFPAVVLLYVTVFLAVIFAAWLCFAWQRRKLRRDSYKAHPCTNCGEKIRFKSEAVFVRCPNCGAKLEVGARHR